jgi:hypothetical protein
VFLGIVEEVVYGRKQKSLLQFTGGDVLLVRDLAGCMGTLERRRRLLASSALVLGVHRSFRDGDRLRG